MSSVEKKFFVTYVRTYILSVLCSILGSMQGMFGASVSELYLLNKLLINIEDSRSMCAVLAVAVEEVRQFVSSC